MARWGSNLLNTCLITPLETVWKNPQEGVKLSQQMQKIDVDMLLHITSDAAAFSAVALETQASAELKTNPYFVAAGCSLGLLQTVTQPSMWRNLELCHVGVGVPGTGEDILGNTREKTRE